MSNLEHQVKDDTLVSPIIEEIESPNEESPELAEIDVDLGHGKEGRIKVMKGDNPEKLAQEFCVKYNLQDSVCKKLTQLIKSELDKIAQEVAYQCSPQEIEQNSCENIIDDEEAIPEDQTIQPHKAAQFFNNQQDESHNEYNSVLQKAFDEAEEKFSRKLCRKDQKSKPKKDLGVSLYYKGMKQKEIWEKICKEEKEERIEKEMLAATFKPNINRNYTKVSYNGKLEERLIQHGVNANLKKEALRCQKYIESAAECTFNPNINNK